MLCLLVVHTNAGWVHLCLQDQHQLTQRWNYRMGEEVNPERALSLAVGGEAREILRR
jgi:hypothetical protein